MRLPTSSSFGDSDFNCACKRVDAGTIVAVFAPQVGLHEGSAGPGPGGQQAWPLPNLAMACKCAGRAGPSQDHAIVLCSKCGREDADMTMAGGLDVIPPRDVLGFTVMWHGYTARWGVCGLCVLIKQLQDWIRDGDAEVRSALQLICHGTLRGLDGRANVRQWRRPPTHLLPGVGGASQGAIGPTLEGSLTGRWSNVRLPTPVAWPASTWPGDWACGRCHYINFRRKWQCRACQASWEEGYVYEPAEATLAETIVAPGQQCGA